MLVAPLTLHPSHTDIVGAEELHHVLVDMLERAGHRVRPVAEGHDAAGVRR
jgi:hypothetical protein